MGDTILNGIIERNLSNDRSVKVRKFTVRKYLIMHAGTDDTVKLTSRNILNKLLQLKSFIQEKLPDVEIIIFTKTLRSDKGKAVLTLRQGTNHLINL